MISIKIAIFSGRQQTFLTFQSKLHVLSLNGSVLSLEFAVFVGLKINTLSSKLPTNKMAIAMVTFDCRKGPLSFLYQQVYSRNRVSTNEQKWS